MGHKALWRHPCPGDGPGRPPMDLRLLASRQRRGRIEALPVDGRVGPGDGMALRERGRPVRAVTPSVSLPANDI